MALRHNVLILEFQLSGTFLLQHFKVPLSKNETIHIVADKSHLKKNWIDEFDPDVNCFSKKKKCYFAIREQETKLQLLRY